ncbi:MAG: hypothetical protein V9G20_22775 [Candidatus Promineifilaceae bacterium]
MRWPNCPSAVIQERIGCWLWKARIRVAERCRAERRSVGRRDAAALIASWSTNKLSSRTPSMRAVHSHRAVSPRWRISCKMRRTAASGDNGSLNTRKIPAFTAGGTSGSNALSRRKIFACA